MLALIETRVSTYPFRAVKAICLGRGPRSVTAASLTRTPAVFSIRLPSAESTSTAFGELAPHKKEG